MSVADPYVAAPKTGAGDTWAQGAPELSDVRSLVADTVHDHDALAGVFDAGGVALDVLGDIGDPLGAVIGCAVGWIVDHVSFLRDPVDWLADDPTSIEASITSWGNVSQGMHRDAAALAAAAEELSADDWSGDAADAYRARVADLAQALDGSGTVAELESVLIAATGGLCAAFRALIFQAIADAVERWVVVGLIALANSAWTFGASLAGWVIDVEIDAGLLAARISAKLAELVGRIGRVAQTLGRDGGRVEQIGQRVAQLSERMMHQVRSSRSLLGWDRRWANQAGRERAGADATHLMGSLRTAHGQLHLDAAKAVVQEGKDVAEVAGDPTPAHLARLAGDGTKDAGAAAGHAVENHAGGSSP